MVVELPFNAGSIVSAPVVTPGRVPVSLPVPVPLSMSVVSVPLPVSITTIPVAMTILPFSIAMSVLAGMPAPTVSVVPV